MQEKIETYLPEKQQLVDMLNRLVDLQKQIKPLESEVTDTREVLKTKMLELKRTSVRTEKGSAEIIESSRSDWNAGYLDRTLTVEELKMAKRITKINMLKITPKK